MIATLAILGAIVLGAHGQPGRNTLSADEFKKIITQGSFGCQREQQSRYDQGQCAPARTVHDIYKQIPGNRETVRQFAPYDLLRTFDLCASRENGNSTDWNKLIAARGKLGAEISGPAWTECEAQIKLEREDCKNAKNLLCAFRQGTHFSCMDLTQMKRKARTLEIQGDQCNVLEALADGRPSTAKEFNERVAESRRGCQLGKKDETDVKCFAENNVQKILARFPTGVNVKGASLASPGLSQTIDMCTDREKVGFIKLRGKALAVYRPGVERDQCLSQLQKDEQDCKKAIQLLCQYSYAVDFACQEQPLKHRAGIRPQDECRDAMNALRVEGSVRW